MPDREGRYAKLLTAILAHTGGTEYALAKAAGIPDQTLASIRLKGAVPRLDTLEKLLTAAGLSWGWFAEQMERIGPPGGRQPKRKGKKS